MESTESTNLSAAPSPSPSEQIPSSLGDALFFNVVCSLIAGVALAVLVIFVFNLTSSETTPLAVAAIIVGILVGVIAAIATHMTEPLPHVPGAAGLTAARFLADWTIRILLIAYLTVWARGAYQLSQAETRARAAAEQERIRQLIRERGLDR